MCFPRSIRRGGTMRESGYEKNSENPIEYSKSTTETLFSSSSQRRPGSSILRRGIWFSCLHDGSVVFTRQDALRRAV